MKKEIVLIGDSRIKNIRVNETHEPLVDLIQEFSDLTIDLERRQVQKISPRISIARLTVAMKLREAQSYLPSGLRLLIKECHRPMSVQKSFWDYYCNFLTQKFPGWSHEQIEIECSKMAAPLEVAPHTTGGAVDLTLIDERGHWLPMGTTFNASPHETENATFTDALNISAEARRNRDILSEVMVKAGFVNYPTEWWHWSYGDKYWAFIKDQPCAIYGTVEV